MTSTKLKNINKNKRKSDNMLIILAFIMLPIHTILLIHNSPDRLDHINLNCHKLYVSVNGIDYNYVGNVMDDYNEAFSMALNFYNSSNDETNDIDYIPKSADGVNTNVRFINCQELDNGYLLLVKTTRNLISDELLKRIKSLNITTNYTFKLYEPNLILSFEKFTDNVVLLTINT